MNKADTASEWRTTGRLLAALVLAGLVGGCTGDVSGGRLSDDQAADRLFARVRHDRTYGDWRMLRCLRFQVEGSTTARVEVAVRRMNQPPCIGEPDVEPVVDRYRVDRDSGVVSRYDAVSARYVQIPDARD
jgi:hypothetical protein